MFPPEIYEIVWRCAACVIPEGASFAQDGDGGGHGIIVKDEG